MSSCVNLPVVRVGSDGVTDQVVIEEPLEILVNGSNLSITMRTPGNDEELAAGFLFTEGLIEDASEVLSIGGAGNQVRVELTKPLGRRDRNFTMTSACGVCGKSSIDSLYANGCRPIANSSFAINSATLRGLPAILGNAQTVFHQTGGLHAAGLFDSEGQLELIREDIGRHNAVDKLIGALLKGGPTGMGSVADRLLLVSGRASFELIQKAAMAGIPMLASVGAPSSLAVETARRFNMTLAGFLRDDRFNIYAGAERIRC